MTDFNYYLNRATNEELLNGFVTSEYGKTMIRKVESLEEYEEILTRCKEPRGIICNGNLFMQNKKADIIHIDMIDFLIKKGLLKLTKQEYDDAEVAKYLRVTHQLLCVHTYKEGKVYLSESYPRFVITDSYVDKHLEVLDKLKIPYIKEVIQ